MDELSRVIGKLEENKVAADRRFDRLEEKVDALNKFKWKATGIMVGVFTVIEILWRAISVAAGGGQ